jgi:acyl-coenzyme A thioesterase 13
MLSSSGKMHGACIVHLIDMYVFRSFDGPPTNRGHRVGFLTRTHYACRCTTLPIAAMSLVNGAASSGSVSQGINVIYHAPASLQVFFFFFLVGDRILKMGT